MISRRDFLKGAAVALIVPLPTLVLGDIKTVSIGFSIRAVEVLRNELDFTYVLRCVATSDEPIAGEVRTAYVIAHYIPEIQSLENLMEEEIKPNIQSYFNDKFKHHGK